MERYPAEVRQRLYTLSYDDEEKVVGVDAEGLSITLTYGDDGTELAGLVIGLPAQVEGGGYVDLRGQVHAERSTDRVLLQSY